MDSLLLIKSLLFLAAVLMLVYFCFLVAKKRLKGLVTKSHAIQIKAHQRLDQKTSLSLVEVEGQKFLIAAHQSMIKIKKISGGNKHPPSMP